MRNTKTSIGTTLQLTWPLKSFSQPATLTLLTKHGKLLADCSDCNLLDRGKRKNEKDFGILDMSETELFGLYQKQRGKIARWIKQNPAETNEV